MPRAGWLAAMVVGWLAAVPAARADDGYLARLAAAVRSRLDAAAAAHVARPVPPAPVAIRWRPQKLGSLDLGAPVVAVAAADLDGDGKAELYLVTSREVTAVSIAGRVHKLGHVAFTGEPALPGSRDVVGTAVVERGEGHGVAGSAVIAAVSAWTRDLRVEWNGRTLSARHGPGGFLVCGDRMALVSGRNHFYRDGAAIYGARCRRDLTDAAGAPLHIRADLSIAVERCAADGNDCRPAGTYEYKDVGVAFEIADVDRDGTPDVIASSASAPGDADAVRVIPLGGQAGKPAFKKSFNGGVAGIIVADGDGDGVPEVVAVVRLAGATRVDLWRLD
jgi:hypothetical protein